MIILLVQRGGRRNENLKSWRKSLHVRVEKIRERNENSTSNFESFFWRIEFNLYRRWPVRYLSLRCLLSFYQIKHERLPTKRPNTLRLSWVVNDYRSKWDDLPKWSLKSLPPRLRLKTGTVDGRPGKGTRETRSYRSRRFTSNIIVDGKSRPHSVTLLFLLHNLSLRSSVSHE